MKKTLLVLSLLSLASATYAQTLLGPWVQVHVTNPRVLPGNYDAVNVATVSPTQCWATASNPNGGTSAFLVSNDATGMAFDSGIISAVGANAGYSTSDISPVGASVTTAIAGNYGLTGGGEVLRTTNAGISWAKVLTFATAGSFLDFVHMFDALNGVAVGDPALGYFEIYTTADGGITWARVPQANIPPVATPSEAGQTNSFFALPNGSIWFGAASSNSANPVRVFKSIDYGLHWTVSTSTTLTGNNITHLAFKNAIDGIAYNYTISTASGNPLVAAVNLIRTADGGNTWAPITN